MFKRWLEARDADAVRSAWRALSPRRHELAHPHRKTTTHGAALLAGAMLGERADWLVGLRFSSANPDKEDGGEAADTFLDDTLNSSARYSVRWRIFERIDHDGTRGVQCVFVEISDVTPPYEGGIFPVVRIFDRDRAVSVPLDANHASTIGDVDLAPLDLYAYSRGCEPHVPVDDVSNIPRLLATTRDLAARLACALDARFDAGATWPRVADASPPPAWAPPRLPDEGVFGDGQRSIEVVLVEPHLGPHARATVHGLPWAHDLQIAVQAGGQSVGGYLHVRLPDAGIDAVLARLETIATLR